MRYFKILLLILTLSSGISAQLDTNSQHYYMFVYFYNLQESVGARLAFSTDGVNWVKYNDEKPIFTPIIAKGEPPLMRDPNIYYDSKTGVFHLTWTTAWKQNNIGYSSSRDLKTWSDQVMIPVGQPIKECSCCWAPEFLYDDLKDSIMVYWSTEQRTNGKKAYYSMTKDFKRYTAPQIYFSPTDATGKTYTVIDETIIKIADGKYYMFFKDERTDNDVGYRKMVKNVHCVWSTTPQGPWWKGPWDDVSNPITLKNFEGPTAYIFGDELRVVSDPYNNPDITSRVVKMKLSEFQGDAPPTVSPWPNGAPMKTATGNFLPGHGSISEVPRAKVMQLLYGQKDNGTYESWTDIKQGDVSVDKPVEPVKEYPLGKRNVGCGTGVGLAFLPPIAFRAFRRRKTQTNKVK